jgi:hypothetical protein
MRIHHEQDLLTFFEASRKVAAQKWPRNVKFQSDNGEKTPFMALSAISCAGEESNETIIRQNEVQ